MPRTYFIYIMSSRTRVLYTGMTSRLHARVYEHRTGSKPGFSWKYRVTRLVYFETTTDARAAVARERQIKSWSRRKREALVEAWNPEWVDLAEEWFESGEGLPDMRKSVVRSKGSARSVVTDPSLRSG